MSEFWAGEFGNEYTARNRVDWRRRIDFWGGVLYQTGARSAYEVGCNAGWNLTAIRTAMSIAWPVGWPVEVAGEDVNWEAVQQARVAGLNVDLPRPDIFPADLIFTAGVLIHIAPDDLEATMRRIVDGSAQYVLAVEYEAETEEMVTYRGHENRLWRRDYGKLYQDMGLTLVRKWNAGEGFDDCTAWLLEKLG